MTSTYVPFNMGFPEAQIDLHNHLGRTVAGIAMKAVVLAGGYATRLRPISYAIPKLLFPVLGKPMIYWTLDLLMNHGVDEVVLAVNYLAESLQAVVGTRYKGLRIRYSLEVQPLGTAGPIKLASQMMRLNETFIAMNGDVLAEVNLTKMHEQHLKSGGSVTDALHQVPDPSSFGVVQLNSAGKIQRFVEKPKPEEAPSRMANAGVYMIEPSVLKMIRPGRKTSLEREIFPLLAERGKLIAFPFEGTWFDIGSLSDYRKANFALLREQAPRSYSRPRTKIIAGSRLLPPIFIGEHSEVQRGARLGPFALLGKHCRIDRKAQVNNSILFDRVTIGRGTIVSGAICASDVSVGDRVRIETGAIISSHVRISDSVRIGKNAIVHPHKEIVADIRDGVQVM